MIGPSSPALVSPAAGVQITSPPGTLPAPGAPLPDGALTVAVAPSESSLFTSTALVTGPVLGSTLDVYA